MAKVKSPSRTDNEVRWIVLHYFHERYRRATGLGTGKRGVAATISVIRKELKADHGLSQQEVQRAMTYLLSQDWIEVTQVVKQVRVKSGMTIPNVTPRYQITAAGIDKIEGQGDFTPDRFQGIRIDHLERSIVTVGDGNRIDARWQEAGRALARLRQQVQALEDVDENDKLDAVTTIDAIEGQLARNEPDPGIIGSAWNALQKVAVPLGIVASLEAVSQLLARFLSG